MDQIVQHKTVLNEIEGNYLDASFIGAPFKVLLTNGYQVSKDVTTGKEIISINDLQGLIAAIVRARVIDPKKLTGEELKFIRSAMAIKSGELAKLLDITPEHYSRCENGGKALSAAQEKLYRVMVFMCMTMTDRAVHKTMKEKLEDTPGEDALRKSHDVLKKVFFDMKIIPVFDHEEEVVFVLTRRHRKDCEDPCDEDGDWEETPLAA